MMYGREKSGSAIVAVKPTNKAERSAAELVEPRAEAKGNVSQHSTDQAQNWATVSQGLEHIRQAAERFAVRHPRWEPYARVGHVRFCAGGAQ
jgi:RNA-directed DNA polymerase